MKKVILIFCLIITSCQSFSNKSNYVLDTTSTDLVFPLNFYRQKIAVTLTSEENKKLFFDGAIKKGDGNLSLFAFTAVGFRVFTLNDQKGNIDVQAHIEQLEDKKDFILKLYPVVKKIFSLRKTDSEYVDRKFSFTLAFPIGDVDVKLVESAVKGEISKIIISKQKYFEFEVENLPNNLLRE